MQRLCSTSISTTGSHLRASSPPTLLLHHANPIRSALQPLIQSGRKTSFPHSRSFFYTCQAMSKKANLGFVKPKQQTLGSFFSKTGSAPKGTPAQQSTLAFVQTREAHTKTEDDPADPADSKNDALLKPGKLESESASREKSPAPKHEMDVDETDSDAPPVKRQRQRKPSGAKPTEPESSKKSKKDSPSPKHKGKTAAKATAKTQVKSERGPSKSRSPPPTPAKDKSASKDKPKPKKSVKKESAVKTEVAEDAMADVEASSASQEVSESEGEGQTSIKDEKKLLNFVTQDALADLPSWKPGQPVPYSALCNTFYKIEMTTKRLEIQAHCSLFLRQVLRLTPDDLLVTVLLMVNKLASDYEGIELGIGESLIMKAIGESTGRSNAIVKTYQQELGDLGLVAAKTRLTQPTMFKPKPLTVRVVHQQLMAIAKTEGSGSQTKKVATIIKLLSSSDADLVGKPDKGIDFEEGRGGPSEAKYIVRALEGKMRLGLAERTVLVALASAGVFHYNDPTGSKGTSPTPEQLVEGETILKQVYSELPSYEIIIPTLIKEGIFKLPESCSLQPGVPLKPMLAKPTKSITEVLDRFEGKSFTCEYKYDGERAQIHYAASSKDNKGGLLKIFSRNSEDLSGKYPDILSRLSKWIKPGVKSFVLDCETVGWDAVEKRVLPFQQLMTRKRKDVKAEDVKVQVCVYAFDVLYFDGQPTVNKSLRERRDTLRSGFTPIEGEFAFATAGDTDQLDQIQTLLDESLAAHCEGLMVKMLDGPGSEYAPSRRSQNWLKVKKDYLDGVGDSLDLVVIGAYFGKGKRTSKYGAFMLACYDPDREQFQSICNIGTGFSDADLDAFHKALSAISIPKPKPFYSLASESAAGDRPDVWFEPRVVWEVKTADLTLSPKYRAAINQIPEGKGVSLRFPRFVRIRDDKDAEQATTSSAVAEMYFSQSVVGKSKGGSRAVDDDFEY